MKATQFVTSALLLLLGVTAQAIDVPPVKEGLWTVTMQMTNKPGGKLMTRTSSICRNHAYDDYMRNLEKNQSACTMDEALSGDTYIQHSTCSMAGSVIKSESVTTKVNDSQYHTEVHSTMTPPLHGGSGESVRTIDYKYQGSCPPGQRVGDMTDSDGNVVNMWKH